MKTKQVLNFGLFISAVKEIYHNSAAIVALGALKQGLQHQRCEALEIISNYFKDRNKSFAWPYVVLIWGDMTERANELIKAILAR